MTKLQVDAIVKAANRGTTGCYHPNHNCIDNCIHTYSGIQLRQICGETMDKKAYAEPTGQVKITPIYKSALQICDPYSRTMIRGTPGECDSDIGILLSILPGTGASISSEKHYILLYFNRGTRFSK